MVPCAKPAGRLFVVLVVVMVACSTTDDFERRGATLAGSPTVGTADPELTAQVGAAFERYRDGVVERDGDAVTGAVDADSLAAMERLAELARGGGEEEIRSLPAAQQLLVLTYRLRPELLEADDPYRALVEAGLAGQDRSLGDLGEVSRVDENRAVGVVVDPTSGAPTPLRWRFVREDGRWRFDLAAANRLLSETIASGAGRAQMGVDELVAATVVDLSGEDAATVDALYTERPG